jgi:transcriptional regulator with XRE-family HTH domain
MIYYNISIIDHTKSKEIYLNISYKKIDTGQNITMIYAIEDIARTLKEAREAKGLSQRALSAKVGLTQAHISSIENAGSNLHLSNLMELARALDLEVMLVPRKAVPAAQGLMRNIEAMAQVQSQPSKMVRYLERSFEKLAALKPESRDIPELRSIVASFRQLHLNKEQIRAVDDAAKDLRRVSESVRKAKASEPAALPAELQRLSQVTGRLRAIRNAVVHAVPVEDMNRVLRAYRLDDGESDG